MCCEKNETGGEGNGCPMSVSAFLSNYFVREIPVHRFCHLLRGIYDVLEKKNTSDSTPDVSLQAVLINFRGMTAEEFAKEEMSRLFQKALEGKMGTFHQELAGCFPGWRSLATGGEGTGLDVLKDDGTEIMEWKNKHNTVNSGSAKAVVDKLMECHTRGMKVHFVQVQCGRSVPRHGAPPEINVMSGRQAYAYLSGRESFFDDLNKTLAYIFKNHKTYASVLKEIS